MSSDTPKEIDPRWSEQVTPELIAAVQVRASEGRITCAVLRKVAEDNGVSYKIAGAAADLADIHVANCDLGCF